MSAPDIETLFDFEGECEPGISAFLAANISIDGYSALDSLDNSDILSPYTSVMLSVGAVEGHVYRHGASKFFDTYYAILQLGTYTSRGTGSAAIHRKICREIRLLMQTCTFGADVLPYHSMSMIRESGSRPQVVASNNYNVTVIGFSCILNIRANSWPALP